MSDLILIHGEDGNTFFADKDEFLSHEGVVGMKWGHRNGPPYPLSRGILKIKTKMLETQAKQANSSLNIANQVDREEPDIKDTAALKKSAERMKSEARYVGARAAERKQRSDTAHYLSKIVSSYYNNRLTVSKAIRKKDSIITKSLQHKVNMLKNLRLAREAGGRIINKFKEANDAREASLMTDEELKSVTENLLAITDYRNMKQVLYGKQYAEDLMSFAANVTMSTSESIKNAKNKFDWVDMTFISRNGDKNIKKENEKLKKEIQELQDQLDDAKK